MALSLHPADYVVFGGLLLFSALVGPFYMWRERRRNATSESYFVGNRSLHIVPTAASLFASFWSAIALVGVPLELYKGGAKFFVSSIGQAVGIVIAAFVAVPMIYKLQLISSYKYFQLRFRSPFLRILGTIFNVLATACYLAVVTLAPCVALEAVTPIPGWLSIIITAVVTMLYTVLGGIKAVVIVDLFQAIVMFLGVVVAIIFGFSQIQGGFLKAIELAEQADRLDFFDLSLDLTNNYNFWIMVIPSIIGTTGVYATSQAAVQRYSALPTVKQASMSIIMMAPQIIVLKILLFFLALAMFAHYDDQGCDPIKGKIIKDQNQLTTFYVADVLHYPGLIGIWFSAIFSGSLSSLSTGYNSVAACIWEDLLKVWLRPKLTAKGVSIVLKIIPFFLGIFTCCLSISFYIFFKDASIIQITNATVSVFGAAIFIAFFNGALIPFTNTIGVSVGMVFATFTIIFLAGGQLVFRTKSHDMLPTKVDNCPALLTRLIESGKYIPDEISDAILNSISVDSNSTTSAVNVASELLLNSTEYMNATFWSGSVGDLETVANDCSNCTASTAADILPEFIRTLFSISYFVFPFLSLMCGVLVAMIVSAMFGGFKAARKVSPGLLIVPNCFYKETPEIAVKKASVDVEEPNALVTLRHSYSSSPVAKRRHSGRRSCDSRDFVAPHSFMFGAESMEDAQAIAMPQPPEYSAVFHDTNGEDESDDYDEEVSNSNGDTTTSNPAYWRLHQNDVSSGNQATEMTPFVPQGGGDPA